MGVKLGNSRLVILTNKYAFKIPNFYKWDRFLYGLLANMQEVKFNKINDGRLAKILLSLPFGFLVVMEKAEPLNDFNYKELYDFCNDKEFIIPAEIKKDSFGYINNKLVAIDYG